jgi:hypothetical protein
MPSPSTLFDGCPRRRVDTPDKADDRLTLFQQRGGPVRGARRDAERLDAIAEGPI